MSKMKDLAMDIAERKFNEAEKKHLQQMRDRRLCWWVLGLAVAAVLLLLLT